MSGRMNWRRCNYDLHARRGGSISIADEAEFHRNDAAARWLDRHQNRRPPRFRQNVMVPATAASSAIPPWE
jgi:antibiotic biosynthesis monooxygenase (ABM) superfamily enzyme